MAFVQNFQRRFIGWLLPRINVLKENTEVLQGDDVALRSQILFVMRTPSLVLRWVVEAACQLLEIPPPDSSGTALSTSSIGASLIALRPRTMGRLRTRQRRKHHDLLARILLEEGGRLIIVPVSVFAGWGPKPFPLTLQSLTAIPLVGEIWTLFILFFYRSSIRIEFGIPFNREPEKRPALVLNRVSKELYRLEKRSRGAPEISPSSLERFVLSGEGIERALQDWAISRDASAFESLAEARRYLREISSAMNGVIIFLLRLVLEPFFRRSFRNVEIAGVEKFRDAVATSPVVLLPNHRSHFDYLLLSYGLYRAHLPLPHIAAGNNLNFFPVGWFLRGAGGFFIRRRIENDLLYKTVLDRYLISLVRQGQVIEFYLEGGRSRSGTTRSAKLGLLKYIVRAILDGNRHDVLFFPVGITYDELPEEESIVAELFGNSKRKETIGALLKFRKKKNLQHGEVLISIQEPISLRAFIEQFGMVLDSDKHKHPPKEELEKLVLELGVQLPVRFTRALAITSRALVSSALYSSASFRLSQEKLERTITALLSSLSTATGGTSQQNAEWSISTAPAALQFHPRLKSLIATPPIADGIKRLLGEMFELSFIAKSASNEIEPTFEERLVYYKNSIIHFLLPLFSAAYLEHFREKTSEMNLDECFFELANAVYPVGKREDWNSCLETARGGIKLSDPESLKELPWSVLLAPVIMCNAALSLVQTPNQVPEIVTLRQTFAEKSEQLKLRPVTLELKSESAIEIAHAFVKRERTSEDLQQLRDTMAALEIDLRRLVASSE